MKIHHAKTVEEAIDDLKEFLECDLYTKFRPEIKLPGKKGKIEKFYRTDFFKSEKDMNGYLIGHFNILIKEIKRLT